MTATANRTGTVLATAPGKLILMGEHAAVHGSPAVVTTIGMTCRASCEREKDGPVRLRLDHDAVHVDASWERLRRYAVEDGDDPAHAAHLPLVALGRFAAARAPHSLPPLTLRIESSVPPSRGMGSSAALAVSVCAALVSLCGGRAGELEPLVAAVEERQHHRASGVDHRTVMRGGTLVFRRSGGGLRDTPIRGAATVLARLSIHDTGATEATGAVVAGIRDRFAGDRLLDAMAACTERFIRALDGDIGDAPKAVTAYQRHLEELGVVPEPVRELVRRIEAAGGAAKISGSGSLTGPGAGALIVHRPVEDSPGLDEILAPYARIDAPLGVEGMRVTPCQ